MKIFISNLVFVLSSVLAINCTDQSTQLLPSDPYERWKAYDLHNYTIDQVRSCFCVDGGINVRVTVRSDTIASVVGIPTNATVPSPDPVWYLTVDSLFSIIRNSTSDSLVVEYNSTYGYPERLDINPQQHPVDGGVLYVTSNLQIQ